MKEALNTKITTPSEDGEDGGLGVDHSDAVMRRHTVKTLGLFQSHF